MRFVIGVTVTLLAAYSTAQAQVVRSAAAPEIEVRHRGLLDTLAVVIGAWPERVGVELSSMKRGSTSPRRVMISSTNNRRALLHEFGHYWAIAHSSKALELADSLRVNPFTRAGEERLADAFAYAIEAYAGNRRATPRDSLTLRFVLPERR